LRVQPEAISAQLSAPVKIPQDAKKENRTPPPVTNFASLDSTGALTNDGPSNLFSMRTPGLMRSVKLIRISAGVAAGNLIRKTVPEYPQIAKTARVSGTVVLQATISKKGTIEDLQYVGGPAMLKDAAMKAVKMWRYKPYLLNNEPVETETTVNVIFALDQR